MGNTPKAEMRVFEGSVCEGGRSLGGEEGRCGDIGAGR